MMKQVILDATKQLLWETGYERMSPRLVMDASGVGQGSLYHHYRGKLELAAAALTEIEKDLSEAADAIFSSDAEPISKIRTYLSLKRDGLKGCRIGRLANEVSVLENTSLQSLLARYFAHVESLIASALRDAQRHGSLSTDVITDDLATTITATVQGGFVLSRAKQDRAAMRRATTGMIALLDMIATGNDT